MTRSGSSSSTSHYSVVEVLDIGEDIVVVVVVLVIVVVVVGRGGGSGSGNGSVSDSDGPAMALAVVVANSMSWEVQQKSKFELDTALPSAVHNPAGSSASQCKKPQTLQSTFNFTTPKPCTSRSCQRSQALCHSILSFKARSRNWSLSCSSCRKLFGISRFGFKAFSSFRLVFMGVLASAKSFGIVRRAPMLGLAPCIPAAISRCRTEELGPIRRALKKRPGLHA